MASKRRKSAALALAFVGIAGLSLASASTLGITGGTLQAGTKDLTDCQTGNVTTVMSTGAYTAALGYQAGNVSVTGISAACTTKKINATLIDAAGAALGTPGSASTIAGTSAAITVPAGISANLVKGIAVVISDN